MLKPMNCPGHILIYKSKTRSYRDLPLRSFWARSTGMKRQGFTGLLRVRGFTQDDAHIFCRPEDLVQEIRAITDFVIDTMKDFGFTDLSIELSMLTGEIYRQRRRIWELATKALEDALKQKGLPYEINAGDGRFTGRR